MIRTRVEPADGRGAPLRFAAWPSRPGRARRHVHAALQHRAHRRDARLLPRGLRAAYGAASRSTRSRSVGVLARACSTLAELVALAALRRPVRPRSGTGGSCSSGPVFGAVAVVITGAHDEHPGHRRHAAPRGCRDRRLASPRSSASSPFATAVDEGLRGARPSRASRRRRWPASWAGSSSRARCSRCSGPAAFLLNAVVYAVSFAIYRCGVPKDAEPASRDGRAHDAGRPRGATAGSSSAATSGCWRRPGSPSTRRSGCSRAQTLFQLVREPNPQFADQLLMGGFEPLQVAASALAIGGLLFFAGLFYWGGRFKTMRRTSIILYGIVGGAVLLVAARRDQPRGAGCAARAAAGAGRRRGRRAVRPRRARRPRRSACSPT